MNAIIAPAPRISIAMATYNGAKYLPQQLDSLAAQTLCPFELVVTDDGSTDNSLEIVESFSERAPFPVHIRSNQRRLGYRDNFLSAAKLCNGDLIAFCDQDDVWNARKLEMVAREFVDLDVLLVIHDAQVVTGELESTGCYRAPDAHLPFAVQYGNSMVFRADLPFAHDIKRPTSERDPDGSLLAHDEWIPFLASCLGKCVNIHSPLIMYRQHGSNACGFGGGENGWIHPAGLNAQNAQKFRHKALCARDHALTLRALIAGANLSPRRRVYASRSLRRWERYSQSLHYRSELYERNLALAARLKNFLKIIILRGYARLLLGRKAFIKDALVALRAEP